MAWGLRDITPRSRRRPPLFHDHPAYAHTHTHPTSQPREEGDGEKHERVSEQGSTNQRGAGRNTTRSHHIHAPFLYSGSPVMSSRPSNFHPNIFSIGSMRLYVVQPVNLWKGTSSSPSFAALIFSASHGQTSPSGTPPSVVRSVGQIGVRPEMRTCQRAARGTRRLDPSAIDSDSRKSVVMPHSQSQKGNTGYTVPGARRQRNKKKHVDHYLSHCLASLQLQKTLGCS